MAKRPPPVPPPDPDRFQEAIRAWRKRIPITDAEVSTLTEAEQEHAFKVAGVTQANQVQEVFDALDRAIEQGTTLGDFDAEVGGTLAEAWGGEDAPRVETIFRTSVMQSYNEGRDEIFSDPAVREARPYLRFDAVGDSRGCDICDPLDGLVKPADDPFWDAHKLPLHPNCFPGGTPILCPGGWRSIESLGPCAEVIAHDGRPRRVLRRFASSFDGVLVALSGPAGQVAYPTPNHPLGTKRGWVAAERLDVDRDLLWVLQDAPSVPNHPITDGQGGVLQPPVVGGLPGGSMPLASVQFGDQHRFRQADIGVVGADGHRQDVRNAQRLQRLRHLALVTAAWLSNVGSRRLQKFVAASLAAAGGAVCRQHLRLLAAGIHGAIPAGVVFGQRAHYAGRREDSRDRDAAAAVPICQGDRGVSSEVEGDDFLLRQRNGLGHEYVGVHTDIGHRQFRGIVYNLEVEGSPTFVAGGFLVHNCRCLVTPLDTEEAHSAGVDRGEPKADPPADGFGTGEDYEPDLSGYDPGIASILRGRLK